MLSMLCLLLLAFMLPSFAISVLFVAIVGLGPVSSGVRGIRGIREVGGSGEPRSQHKAVAWADIHICEALLNKAPLLSHSEPSR